MWESTLTREELIFEVEIDFLRVLVVVVLVTWSCNQDRIIMGSFDTMNSLRERNYWPSLLSLFHEDWDVCVCVMSSLVKELLNRFLFSLSMIPHSIFNRWKKKRKIKIVSKIDEFLRFTYSVIRLSLHFGLSFWFSGVDDATGVCHLLCFD